MKKTKIIAFLLSIIILFNINPSFAANQEKIVGLDENVTSYIIGNEENGDIYYEKNSEQTYPIASLSKLMTYLVVKDAISEGKIDLDTEVKVSKEAAELNSREYSKLGLEEGEVFTIKELLEGLMVVSGNDCAYQLAEEVAGSEVVFTRMMNSKASELGLKSQVYYNASGVETENNSQNSSSAKDLFELTHYIIKKYPEILEYGSIREIVDPRRNIDEKSTLPLIGEIPGVDGLKTGTTPEAGSCLITTTDMSKIDSKDNYRTIGIVLGADQKDTRDSVMSDLIYYVSRYYSEKVILNKDEPIESVKTNSAQQGYVDVYPKENVKLIVKEGENPSIKYNFKDNIKAPIKADEVLGNALVNYKDDSYDIDLISKSDSKEASMLSKIARTSRDAADFLLQVLIAR